MDNKSPDSKVILIRKASGDEEAFSVEKLKHSLINAGARRDTISEVVEEIEKWIFPGVTTKQIYSRAFSLLKRETSTSSMRYKLKQAILELGPTGYPFESLVGQVFERKGYQTEVGVVVDGRCITHEMDVIATRDAHQHIMECKYHKGQGTQVSIQVPLYVRARVNDIIETRKLLPEYKDFNFCGWVVTNTRFSSDSMAYGKCSGLHLLGWDYPKGEGLKDIIEEFRLYPITILHKLTKKEKQYLLDQRIVTCSQLRANPKILESLGITKKKHTALMREISDICS